ncbi:MAG: hypothetical protein ACM30I_01605 [Gemmatimonas sp.]
MFIETGYTVFRNAIPPLLCRYIAEEYNLMLNNGFLAYDDKQVEKAYFAYALPQSEALLTMLLPTVAKEIGAELLPTYSYSRVYLPGAWLKKHVDRAACEVSATVALAQKTAKPWPIYVQSKDGQTVEVILNPGDMLIYAGMEMPHWRDPFDGEWQLQAFLHYVRRDGPNADCALDKRPRLGAEKARPATQQAEH